MAYDYTAAAFSSGYDRDYHDDHEHGHDHDSHGGHSASGYGKKDECCPLVVDFLCLAAILFAIAGATLFLNQVHC